MVADDFSPTSAVDSTAEVVNVLGRKKDLERREVVYRLSGVNPDEGIDVYEIVPLLTKFRDLVTETAMQMGCKDEISIKVRPFKEGSFITEFVLQGQRTLTDLFASEEAAALANALALLGFLGVNNIASIPTIVSLVKGRMSDYKRNEDGSYTYGHGADAVTVNEEEHNALQSPKIADLYGDVAVSPLVKFDGAVQQVNIYVRDESAPDDGLSEGATFNEGNARDFAEYSRSTALLDKLESNEDVSVTHGLVLTPVSGPYDGAENGYTFSDGDGGHKYKKVAIEDEGFRAKLEASAVRLAKGDALKVDMKTTQTRTKSGKLTTRYAILKVIEYDPRRVPKQTSLNLDD